ncbi:MAG: SIMPL domain-containing protein [Verrucomicrobiota bacterium]
MRVLLICLSSFLTFILAAIIVAKPWVTIHHTKPIVVKGYAEQPVHADTGSLTASVQSTGQSNADAYRHAGRSLERVHQLATEILGEDFALIELPASVYPVNKLNAQGKKTNFVDFYSASRSYRFDTDNVQGLEKLGRALYDLNAESININVNGPEFFISNLDEIKLNLVKAATANGKERAQIMASSSGEDLGSLVAARQGVIQITKTNSTETSSWGMYDTQTIDKVVKLVVTLEYDIGS